MWLVWTLVGCGPDPLLVEELEGLRAENAGLRAKIEAIEARAEPSEQGEPAVGEPITLREALEPEVLARMGRAILHRGPNGVFDGYRVSGIRTGSPAERAGLENADIVHTINGMPLTSMEDTMAAYSAVTPETKTLTITVTRRGKPLVLEVPLDEELAP